jgi:hypothetical protein
MVCNINIATAVGRYANEVFEATNWFVNHEGSHLYLMESSSEKTSLLHSHAHPHAHAGGFLASIKRALGINTATPPRKLRPASAVETLRPAPPRPPSMLSEYEMEEGHERTRKNYAKLNRKSRMF